MKNLLSVLAILTFTVGVSSASAVGVAQDGVETGVRASGKTYRVHRVLKPSAHLVRASVMTSGGRAGSAAGSSTGSATVAMNAAEAADASEGYDAAVLSTNHHVRCLIKVEQADAVIYVDGARAGSSHVEIDWDGSAVDHHTVRVQKDGMVPFEQTFSQGVGDAAIYVRLESLEGK